ncbi:rod shape-determining protein MreD [Roseitranquillus sediminis]|uniref:rod shape-determining protein MreD n=1 Tax=Roseitranquillus sediminis TaxID=2809051 RepID=UPI001D0C0094|nr:rod shape-determining protein MreD [Roseitranquillus sediminis]MBM9594522.1 rod shape-determining protein MreD [Roseitranquillus sediminis]
MAETLTTRRWSYRGLYVAVALVTIGAALLPLGDGTSGVPGPELPVVVAFAWILRRPDYVPPLLLAAVVLLTDIVGLRPLGLWTALVVLGAEFLRSRESLIRDLPFVMEWLLASAVLVAIAFAYWLALSLFVVAHPGLGSLLLQALVSAAVYPVVVALSVLVFKLRKAAPGEVDALGHRL